MPGLRHPPRKRRDSFTPLSRSVKSRSGWRAWRVSMGLTAILYGVALLVDRTHPKWLGGLAMIGGVPTMIAGVVIAHTGFSGLAMAINIPANALLLAWMLILGACMWRRGGARPEEPAA